MFSCLESTVNRGRISRMGIALSKNGNEVKGNKASHPRRSWGQQVLSGPAEDRGTLNRGLQ